MRRLRTRTGIAAALAIACALIAQAGPAEATSVLCKENVATCSPGAIWPTGSEFTVATKEERYVEFEMGINKQRCFENSSTIALEGTTGEGNVYGTWRNLTFNACEKNEEGVCLGVEARNLPWKAVFKAGASPSENKIELSSSGKGEPAIRIFCPLGVTCTFGVAAGFHVGMPTIEGQPQILVEAFPVKIEGGTGCSKSLTWLAAYTSISPTAYLTH
jgi:hypothetical protein